MNAVEAAKILTAWLIPAFIALLGAIVLWKIWKGEIALKGLINETDGDASMSRFQFLIFTFVIAMSLFLIIINKMKFPDVPASVWTLLGISGGSYLISKGIQSRSEEEEKRIELEIERKEAKDKNEK
ncbi:MAG: hypothetical protein ACUBOA_13930 [Candidatus Loosdrechtia sp.]|uniref:hypothetical protein n=1 Tax=Candidatus Loosdrechtia sp. TaxID=3101272 RepID=UPI003A76C10E|nr:MAG: hypothetical protein QY305_05860 [Candidatus Jettenia sp. AMX2]